LTPAAPCADTLEREPIFLHRVGNTIGFPCTRPRGIDVIEHHFRACSPTPLLANNVANLRVRLQPSDNALVFTHFLWEVRLFPLKAESKLRFEEVELVSFIVSRICFISSFISSFICSWLAFISAIAESTASEPTTNRFIQSKHDTFPQGEMFHARDYLVGPQLRGCVCRGIAT
jgi:hypothetical protein